MKGLKEFIELLSKDEALKAEVEKVQDDAAKVVEIAKKHGYSFTEDEYNDLKMAAVSGGGAGSEFLGGVLGYFGDKINDRYHEHERKRHEKMRKRDFERLHGGISDPGAYPFFRR